MSAPPIQLRPQLSRLTSPLSRVEGQEKREELDDEYDESDDEGLDASVAALSVSLLLRECDVEVASDDSDDEYDESDSETAGAETTELSVSLLMRECDRESQATDVPHSSGLGSDDEDDDDAYDESSDEDLRSPRVLTSALVGMGSRYRLLEMLSSGRGSRTLLADAGAGAAHGQQHAPPQARASPALYRRQVAEELLHSEQRYCKYLHVITELFMEPMEEAMGSSAEMVSREEFRSLFGGIKTMQKISEEFHRSLAVRLENWSEQQFLGDVVVKMIPLMGVYKTYKEQMNARPELLSRVQARSARFDSWCKVMLEHPTAEGLTLDTFLIMPVQRLPRVLLLIENLLNATEPSHSDYRNLVDAANDLQALMQAVNASDKSNLIYKLYALQGMAPECSGLLQPWRTYIAEFDLHLLPESQLPSLRPPTDVPAGFIPSYPFTSTREYAVRLKKTIAEQQQKQQALCIPHSNTEPNVMKGRRRKRVASMGPTLRSASGIVGGAKATVRARSPSMTKKRRGSRQLGKSKEASNLRVYLCNDCIVYLGSDAAFCGKVSLLNTYIVDVPDCPEEGRVACFTLYNPSYCFTVVAADQQQKEACITLVSQAIRSMRDSGIGLAHTNVSKDDLPLQWKDAICLNLSQFSNFLFALETELLGHPLFDKGTYITDMSCLDAQL